MKQNTRKARNTTFVAMMKRYGGKPTAMKSKMDYSRKVKHRNKVYE